MMKFILLPAMACCILFSSCSPTPPEKYLDKAVLNSTAVAGFAGNTLSLELKNPPVKFTGSGEKIMVTRQQIIKDKIRFSKKVLQDLAGMNINSDMVDIMTTSVDLHHFLIAVYETDYMALAKLYDEGAPAERIAAFDSALKEKHASMFELHYENLIRGGKLYAAKHNIHLNELEDRQL